MAASSNDPSSSGVTVIPTVGQSLHNIFIHALPTNSNDVRIYSIRHAINGMHVRLFVSALGEIVEITQRVAVLLGKKRTSKGYIPVAGQGHSPGGALVDLLNEYFKKLDLKSSPVNLIHMDLN